MDEKILTCCTYEIECEWCRRSCRQSRNISVAHLGCSLYQQRVQMSSVAKVKAVDTIRCFYIFTKNGSFHHYS
jgi:hypothetical protein